MEGPFSNTGRTINTSLTSCDIVDLTSTRMYLERKNKRKMLLKIFSNVQLLTLAFRGNWNEKAGAESESNSLQLLMLRSLDNSSIADWLKRKSDKFTSPAIQNEMISVMALGILRKISENIRNTTFFF